LRWKYGYEELPEEVKPKTMDQALREQELVDKARKGQVVEKPARPEKAQNLSEYNVFVNNEYFKIEVEQVGGKPSVSSVTHVPRQEPESASSAQQGQAEAASGGQPQVPAEGTPVEAPLNGIIVSYQVKDGDKVDKGDPVLVLEAMKMENTISAPAAGVVRGIQHKEGDSVQRGDVLAVIA
jgi:biotin carboxyl carrier protein